MNILISLATGMLGKALLRFLQKQNHNNLGIITRSFSKAKKIFPTGITIYEWDSLTQESISEFDVVIHLAGAPLLHFPWSMSYQKTLYNSRIYTTKKLVSLLPKRCHTFICGSAVGYYPSSLDAVYTSEYRNTSPSSFLEKLCVDRESQASQAETATRRVILLRTGIVLGNQGFYTLLRTAIHWYAGIIPGTGNQGIATITMNERVNLVDIFLCDTTIHGPQDLVSKSVSLKIFMKQVAKYYNRPLLFSIPPWVLKKTLGAFSQFILDSHFIQPNGHFTKYNKYS